MKTIDFGSTLYDANKQIISQVERPLTHPEIGGKVEELEDFFKLAKVANY